MSESTLDIGRFVSRNKYLFLILFLGIILVLLPGGDDSSGADSATESEQRLGNALRTLEGVGEITVLLAEGKNRNEGYTGAVIFCHGADSASVRLKIVEAVSVYTGLSSNKIKVLKMKN